MITLTSLHKQYRTRELETTALADVSIEVAKGEFVAVMGASGCGKSTLLNIIGMIDRPDAGSYQFDHIEVTSLTESARARLRRDRLGYIFQNFNLLEELTVFANVELPLLYRRVPRDERRRKVREVLELVGLNGRASHRPGQLSGGQQQRVAVARAVVTDPELILADEPTGNLDSVNGEDVMQMLQTLNEQGATIVMVTHSPSHAARAGRIIAMRDGAIVPADTLEVV